MTPSRAPFLLRLWFLATRYLSVPITFFARRSHARMGGTRQRFPERLGQSTASQGEAVIWFHGASLGEVTQIRPLARRLLEHQHERLLVTTSTVSGADWVAREMPEAIHQFLPIDTPAAVTRFLDNWSLSVAIFVEGDLYPRLLTELAHRGVLQVLLNARHSRSRERFPALYRHLLATFALATARSQEVADGLIALGMPRDRVRVMPDLKAAASRLSAPTDLTESLRKMIGERPVWLAASTHPDDEAAVLAAHGEVIKAQPAALLIVAPRHPDRGPPLHEAAAAMGFAAALRSASAEIEAETQIYIANTLGELGAFFAVSPIAFLGGSFGAEGGHNPYEPAHFGTAILSGPNTRNFADAYAALSNGGAALCVEEPTELGKTVLDLVTSNTAEQMGRRGATFMQASDDGLDEYARLIADVAR